MDIQVGTRLRFTPAGWSTGPECGAYIKKTVDGTVDYVNKDTGVFRVAYEAKGSICHESFKLPLVPGDTVKILR